MHWQKYLLTWLNMLLVGDKARIPPWSQAAGISIVELDVDGKPVKLKGFKRIGEAAAIRRFLPRPVLIFLLTWRFCFRPDWN